MFLLDVFSSNLDRGEIYMKIWMKSMRLIYIQNDPFGSFCVGEFRGRGVYIPWGLPN